MVTISFKGKCLQGKCLQICSWKVLEGSTGHRTMPVFLVRCSLVGSSINRLLCRMEGELLALSVPTILFHEQVLFSHRKKENG